MNSLFKPFHKNTNLANRLEDKSNDRSVLLLQLILIVGFILRVSICFFANKHHIQRDTIDYFEHADILLAGGYKNYFPNGYPLIIALSKLLSALHFVTILLWINILLSITSVYFVFDIIKRISSNIPVALTGAFLLTILPTQLNYVRWILSETPSAFFLLAFYFFYFRDKNFIAGISIGIATIIRTELLLIFPVIVLSELLVLKKIRITLFVGLLIPVLTIGFYCKYKTGSFSISGHSKVNIAYSITASGSHIDWLYNDKHPEIKTSSDATKAYLDILKKNPVQFLKNKAANLWELWGFYPSSSDGNRSFAARLLIGFINFFLLVFGLWGWWLQRKNLNYFFIIVPFFIVTVVHVFLLALPRYTYVAEPFLIILASLPVYLSITNLINKNAASKF